MNKKKIFIVFSSSYIGGVEKNLIKLASNRNNQNDLKYYLFSFGKPGDLSKIIKETTSNYYNFYSIFPIVNIFFVIKKLIFNKFDYLYICGFRYSIYFRLLKILIPDVKIVIAQRWNPDSNNLIDIILRISEKYLSKITFAYITNSLAAKNTLKRISNNKHIYTIYNGIEVKKETDIAEKEYDICVLAHISKRKGHLNFIEKIYELRKINPNLKVVFIGKNLLNQKITKKINHFRLNECIKIKGYTNNPEKYLKKSRLLVLPSLYMEGVPTSIIEAFSNRVPAIAYDIDGNNEVIIDNINGFLINKRKDNLIEKILEVFSSKKIYNYLMQNTPKVLIDRFSNENFYDNHNNFFRNS